MGGRKGYGPDAAVRWWSLASGAGTRDMPCASSLAATLRSDRHDPFHRMTASATVTAFRSA
jgi:hypothetical protein